MKWLGRCCPRFIAGSRGVSGLVALAVFFLMSGSLSAQDKKTVTKTATPVRTDAHNSLQKPSNLDANGEEINPNAPAAPQSPNGSNSIQAAPATEASPVYVVVKLPEMDKTVASEPNPAKMEAYKKRLAKKFGSDAVLATDKPGVFIIKVKTKNDSYAVSNHFGKSSTVFFENQGSLTQRLRQLNVKLTN